MLFLLATVWALLPAFLDLKLGFPRGWVTVGLAGAGLPADAVRLASTPCARASRSSPLLGCSPRRRSWCSPSSRCCPSCATGPRCPVRLGQRRAVGQPARPQPRPAVRPAAGAAGSVPAPAPGAARSAVRPADAAASSRGSSSTTRRRPRRRARTVSRAARALRATAPGPTAPSDRFDPAVLRDGPSDAGSRWLPASLRPRGPLSGRSGACADHRRRASCESGDVVSLLARLPRRGGPTATGARCRSSGSRSPRPGGRRRRAGGSRPGRRRRPDPRPVRRAVRRRIRRAGRPAVAARPGRGARARVRAARPRPAAAHPRDRLGAVAAWAGPSSALNDLTAAPGGRPRARP